MNTRTHHQIRVEATCTFNWRRDVTVQLGRIMRLLFRSPSRYIRPALVSLLCVASALFSACTRTTDACSTLPSDVRQYLLTQPGWHVVDTKDLVSDDQILWQKNRPALCPGMTIVDLDGTGNKAYALAMLHSEGSDLLEKLVVVSRRGGAQKIDVLVTAEIVPSPWVVWRNSPGTAREFDSGQTTVIPTDSIIYEKMESTATLYFLSGDKFRSILITD
jgi:hypothetical protein